MADTVKWQKNEVFIRYGEGGAMVGAHVGFLLFALNSDGTINQDIRPTEKVMPVVDGVVAGFEFDAVMTDVLTDAIARGDLHEARFNEMAQKHGELIRQHGIAVEMLDAAKKELARHEELDRQRQRAAKKAMAEQAAMKSRRRWFWRQR
jgi:hypothetical protein